MAVSKPSLQPTQKIFTKQDFLDGKCTADGNPLTGEVKLEEVQLPEAPVETETSDEPEVSPEEEPKDGE